MSTVSEHHGVNRAEGHLALVQKELKELLGVEVLRALHQRKPVLDITAMVLVYVVGASMVYCLGQLPFGLAWLACLLLQGIVLMWMGLINHDLFVHRNFGQGTTSWWLSLLYTVPLTLDNVGYRDTHQRHHRFIGTIRDGESYKQRLDTSVRRLLFCTAIGFRRVVSGYITVAHPDRETLRRQRQEKRTKIIFFIALATLICWFPRYVLFGYVIPLVLVLPVLNSLRAIIEHADVDPDNPFALATFYRTGTVSRILCLWDSGDCHLIHHVFPNIPFYNMDAALRVMRPLLIARGVVERRSYRKLLLGWFWHSYEHRTKWPAD